MMVALCALVIAIFSSFTNAQRTFKAQKQQTKKFQSVRINLTGRGYQPSSFRLKKGVPARVTFIRKTPSDCGEEIVIPAYNIRRFFSRSVKP